MSLIWELSAQGRNYSVLSGPVFERWLEEYARKMGAISGLSTKRLPGAQCETEAGGFTHNRRATGTRREVVAAVKSVEYPASDFHLAGMAGLRSESE